MISCAISACTAQQYNVFSFNAAEKYMRVMLESPQYIAIGVKVNFGQVEKKGVRAAVAPCFATQLLNAQSYVSKIVRKVL